MQESPPELIAYTQKTFSIQDDINAIHRIKDSIGAARVSTEKKRQASRTVLHELARHLELAKANASAAQQFSDEQDHVRCINELDRENFGLARSINELESKAQSLDSILERLKDEVEQIDRTDIANDPNAFNGEESTILKLSLYRSFGITLEEDEVGGYARAIIRKHLEKRCRN